jgi:hypothetical protein
MKDEGGRMKKKEDERKVQLRPHAFILHPSAFILAFQYGSPLIWPLLTLMR